MMSSLSQPSTTDLPSDSYVLLGLATCFLQREGEAVELAVFEPIPSAYLEALMQGIQTSYRQVWGMTVAEALTIAPADLPGDFTQPPQRCADFEQRLLAAARTYQSRPATVQIIPVGTTRSDLNYSTEKKRILNPKNKVSRADNVKQHKYTHEVL